MNIKKVTSNIKSPGGEPWSFDIGHLNLLVGPNESGKSAIAEAVQLALSGSAYGIFLRSGQVKAGPILGDLSSPGEEDPIFAEVEYEDGTVSRWEMNKNGRPRHTGSQGVALPIGELRAALGGSVAKARNFFAGHLLDPFSRKELEAALPQLAVDIIEALDRVLPDYGHPISPNDLVEAQTKCGKYKREGKAMIKAADTVLPLLNYSRSMSALDETQWMEDLCLSLKFEWLKKQFLSSELPEEKAVLQKLALTLGEKDKLRSLEGSAQYWDILRDGWRTEVLLRAGNKAKRIRTNGEGDVEVFGALASALESVLSTMLEKPLEEYCRKVNKFLPKGDKFGIDHSGAQFKIFLERGGTRHYALSGSAEARTLAAMAAALSSDGQPAVIILDDRMWDSKNLARTMERLEKSPCQAILMSTFKPRGRARSGWNYVEVVPKSYDGKDEVPETETEAEGLGERVQEEGL